MRSPDYDHSSSTLLSPVCEGSAKAQYAEAIAQGNALPATLSQEVQQLFAIYHEATQ